MVSTGFEQNTTDFFYCSRTGATGIVPPSTYSRRTALLPTAIRLIILDLDGTLIDSLADLTDAANQMRQAFALSPLSLPDVKKLVGEGARRLVERALPDLSPEKREQGLEIFLRYNFEHIADKAFFYPGVLQTLVQLHADGFTLAVASNKSESHCREILRLLRSEQLFAAIFGADSATERKPSPEPLFHLMRQVGCTIPETMMVVDTNKEMKAGKASGVFTVGCSYGYGAREDLEPADCVVDSFPELLKVLGKG
jgi:phosphoglycolate phosphatase